MKVTLINHSDIRGGASMASLRLLDALRTEGVDARMIVKSREGLIRPDIDTVGGNLRDKLCFVGERAEIFVHNGFSRRRLFKVSTASCGLDISRHPWITKSDILAINWINQGMLSLKGIAKLGAMKPIVWTMHDMWPMTGICHLTPQGCKLYKEHCGQCPLLGRSASNHDISARIHKHKERLYNHIGPNFVAVSNWLANIGRNSSLLRQRQITIIPNAFDVEAYRYEPKLKRIELKLPDESYKLITMCAARLDDYIKNLPAAIESINIAQKNAGHRLAAVFIGEIRQHQLLDSLQVPYVYLGSVKDSRRLADIYAHSTVVISSSHFETLGYTLIEGMSAGAIPVAFGGDGRDDIIEHQVDGYLATPDNTTDLANGIYWAISANIPRGEQHARAAVKFDAKAVAQKYIALFNKISTSKI